MLGRPGRSVGCNTKGGQRELQRGHQVAQDQIRQGLFFFFNFFFRCGPFFEVFIEFVTILIPFFFFFLRFFFFCPQGMWDLSSPIRDQTCTPCIGS